MMVVHSDMLMGSNNLHLVIESEHFTSPLSDNKPLTYAFAGVVIGYASITIY